MNASDPPRKFNWSGISLITICAIGSTLATSAIILSDQQTRIASEAPYHLEGGEAFSAYAFANFFTFGALFFSSLLIIGYLSVLFYTIQRAVSPHIIVAGALLLPCALLIGSSLYHFASN